MVDLKISELDVGVGISGIDVFPFASIGSTLTKKVTFDNFESALVISGAYVVTSGALVTDIANLVTVSGASVTDVANLVTVSGAGVIVSGATVTNKDNLATVSGAGVVVSGALVTDIANLVTVSGASVTDVTNLTTVSGAGVTVSGAAVTNTTHRGSAGGTDHSDVSTNNSKVSYTKTNVKATINHGGTAGTARPSGFDSVEWIGTVEPSNSTNDDTWINTT